MVAPLIKKLLKTPVQWLGTIAGRHRWPVGNNGSLLILTYHRVLPDDHPDRATEQPGMYVSPATLAMHLNTLSRHFEFVHLDDWLSLVDAGSLESSRYCAITFDDGWRDNYDYAFPMLREANVPATFFIVTNQVGTAYQFWPNRLGRMLTNMPPEALKALTQRFAANGVEFVNISSPASVAQIDGCIEACKQLPDKAINQLLDEFETNTPDRETVRDLMTWDEIREMAASGLARFGSHTMNHTRLNDKTPDDVMLQEVTESKSQLEMELDRSSSLFCYPNGDYSPKAIAAVKATYDGAVTTETGWANVDSDRYRLQRIGLHQDISSTPVKLLSRIGGLL